MCAQQRRRYSCFEPISARHVLPVRRDRRLGRNAKGILLVAQDLPGRFGGEQQWSLQVGRIAADQVDPIGVSRAVVQDRDLRSRVNDVAIADFDIQVDGLTEMNRRRTATGPSVPRMDFERLSLAAASRRSSRRSSARASSSCMYSWSSRVRPPARPRKFLAVLSHRVGECAGGRRQHLLLPGAQRRFRFANELAAGPGQASASAD